MARPDHHRGIVNAIVDADVEAAALVKEAEADAEDISGMLQVIARKLIALRKQGKVTPERAKALWTEAWRALTLAAFAKRAGKIQATVDRTAAAEFSEAKKLGPELLQVAAVRSTDAKARELEKAGVLNDAGKVEG